MITPYRPEPYVDFTQPQPREHMLAALSAVRGQLALRYPLRIGGKPIETPETIQSTMPASPKVVVGHVASGTRAHAEQALDAAARAFAEWRHVEPETRARVLLKAAAIMRRRVYELSAWMCFEVSKSWIEAYADTCEAIDFLEFYGREMVRLGGPQAVTPFPGEENELRYVPLGVGVVIPPWNFPLAICTGMTSAALVTGNCVVLKPASASPVIAAKMVEIFEEAGLPPGVLNFVPGPGGGIGDTLVESPKTRFVAFTGSKEVGLRIFERCGRLAPGQIWLKRSILEMGGKDAILVDETADVDAAAEGIAQAAFGFQGQKCSACSRAILHADVYDAVLERVVERARRLTIGDTTLPENFYLGAVIDEKAQRKMQEYIALGRKEGRAVLVDQPAPRDGSFVPPTIFADMPHGGRVCQEEIFGPVLAVVKCRDFAQGLELANGTEYGLTGGFFSRDRLRIERARRDFHVGNLYINRKCTGALVDVQPFGGFNLSGTDSKAGGRDYLQLFMQGKAICERF